jgi:hypothetical protein
MGELGYQNLKYVVILTNKNEEMEGGYFLDWEGNKIHQEKLQIRGFRVGGDPPTPWEPIYFLSSEIDNHCPCG